MTALPLYRKGWLGKGEFEAHIPDFYDAYPVKSTSPLLAERNSPYPVFLIQTKLGIGPPEKIKKIDVTFEFQGVDPEIPIQLIEVGPSEKFWIDGEIKIIDIDNFDLVGNLNVKAGIASLFGKVGGELLLNKEKHKLKEIKQTRPSYVTEITSHGIDATANWFFRQGEGIKPTGKYNLQMLFEIRDKHNTKNFNDLFIIKPKIKINGDELNKGREGDIEIDIINHILPIEFHSL